MSQLELVRTNITTDPELRKRLIAMLDAKTKMLMDAVKGDNDIAGQKKAVWASVLHLRAMSGQFDDEVLAYALDTKG